jgi:hypothetical protein
VQLGREPEGGVSPDQARALLEHLKWLGGMMPSERNRQDREARTVLQMEAFSWRALKSPRKPREKRPMPLGNRAPKD